MIKINQRIDNFSSEIAKMNRKDASRVLDEAYAKIAEIKKIQIEKNNFPGMEKQNFRVDSAGWEGCKSGGFFSLNPSRKYLKNPEGDIIEFLQGKVKGEQLFTWCAAMRETAKAGKIIPSKRGWRLIESNPDLINFIGCYCSDASGFGSQSFAAYYWSSNRNSIYDRSASCVEISYLKRSFGDKIKQEGKEIWRELSLGTDYFLSVRCFAEE